MKPRAGERLPAARPAQALAARLRRTQPPRPQVRVGGRSCGTARDGAGQPFDVQLAPRPRQLQHAWTTRSAAPGYRTVSAWSTVKPGEPITLEPEARRRMSRGRCSCSALLLGSAGCRVAARAGRGHGAGRHPRPTSSTASTPRRSTARAGAGSTAASLRRGSLWSCTSCAGLAAFNLSGRATRSGTSAALLRLDPDYSLDPFVVPPPAVGFFEKLKQRWTGAGLPAAGAPAAQERAPREAERRERAAPGAPRSSAAALEELPRQVTVRTVEKRNFLVNFVPFGAGPVPAGPHRPGRASSRRPRARSRVTSVIAYFALRGPLREDTVELDDVLTETGKATITVHGIPTSRARPGGRVAAAEDWLGRRLLQRLRAGRGRRPLPPRGSGGDHHHRGAPSPSALRRHEGSPHRARAPPLPHPAGSVRAHRAPSAPLLRTSMASLSVRTPDGKIRTRPPAQAHHQHRPRRATTTCSWRTRRAGAARSTSSSTAAATTVGSLGATFQVNGKKRDAHVLAPTT